MKIGLTICPRGLTILNGLSPNSVVLVPPCLKESYFGAILDTGKEVTYLDELRHDARQFRWRDDVVCLGNVRSCERCTRVCDYCAGKIREEEINPHTKWGTGAYTACIFCAARMRIKSRTWDPNALVAERTNNEQSQLILVRG